MTQQNFHTLNRIANRVYTIKSIIETDIMDEIEPAEDELTTLICRMTEAVNNLDNYLDDRINNIYLETREATRQSLINRFMNLYVGDMDLDSMDSYAIYMMTKELEEAQALGKLNLETNQGIENLKMIVSKYDK